MLITQQRTIRAALLATTLAVVAAAPGASADSTLVATRSGGTGIDVGTAEGTWKFTVTGISGKPAQVIVRIESADGSQVAFASDHPKVGQTFESYQLGAAGVNRLRATLWGGPNSGSDSVTLSVDAP